MTPTSISVHRACWRLADLAKDLVRDLAATFFDDACSGCDRAIDRLTGPTCAPCDAELARSRAATRCVRCSHPLESASGDGRCGRCLRSGFEVQAPLAHAGAARRLVHALKYGRRREVAETLARATLADDRVAAAVSAADLLVPVPADPLRRHERGFNQAEQLAAELARLARHRGLAAVRMADVLRRRRDAPQVGRTGGSRRRAPRGRMRPRALARHRVAGRRVVLVDDVVTTGATVAEAARVLLRLGAASVVVIACTRTPGPLVTPSRRARGRGIA